MAIRVRAKGARRYLLDSGCGCSWVRSVKAPLRDSYLLAHWRGRRSRVKDLGRSTSQILHTRVACHRSALRDSRVILCAPKADYFARPAMSLLWPPILMYLGSPGRLLSCAAESSPPAARRTGGLACRGGRPDRRKPKDVPQLGVREDPFTRLSRVEGPSRVYGRNCRPIGIRPCLGLINRGLMGSARRWRIRDVQRPESSTLDRQPEIVLRCPGRAVAVTAGARGADVAIASP
ncbi:hypothetical protein HDA45_001741 [Amycolatopsis umgeniensis]|uniref:Uncharacterized protein n=1 Tax=Amycolatopsis umgeniensis TaxID=336628 RepID=A0A841AZE7_9PSEU|nr:hypothetical protein [Amycolatopsis umgeniensis]